MARVLKGSHSFTYTPRVHPLTEWTIPTFAFPAEAGTHLPTPEGWKAELALGMPSKVEQVECSTDYSQSWTKLQRWCLTVGSISLLLHELNWLPVPDRIKFRLAVLVLRCRNNTAPACLQPSSWARRLAASWAVNRHWYLSSTWQPCPRCNVRHPWVLGLPRLLEPGVVPCIIACFLFPGCLLSSSLHAQSTQVSSL